MIDESLPIIDDDGYKKDRFIRGETSEFHSLSIDRIVQIIDDHRSRKDRDSFGESRELDWISIDTDHVDVEIN